MSMSLLGIIEAVGIGPRRPLEMEAALRAQAKVLLPMTWQGAELTLVGSAFPDQPEYPALLFGQHLVVMRTGDSRASLCARLRCESNHHHPLPTLVGMPYTPFGVQLQSDVDLRNLVVAIAHGPDYAVGMSRECAQTAWLFLIEEAREAIAGV